jgi:hypothetical protein
VAAHKTRTKLEAAICKQMDRRGVAHAHRVRRYRVRMKSGRTAAFQPAIVAHRGPILFLVEPCLSYTPGGGAVERHARFLNQHSAELVLILAAPASVAARLPRESYDELYEDTELARLVSRIRDQDPHGAVKQFDKRKRVRAGS